MSKIRWQYYPKSNETPKNLMKIVDIFEKNEKHVNSFSNTLKSDQVLEKLRSDLVSIGYIVEKSKKLEGKIKIPVLFGENGKVEKSFDADAFEKKSGTVLEVEAGRGVMNYQFLKDLFQACMMPNTNYLVIAVRQIYLNTYKDFDTVKKFFDSLYASKRIELPLKGILIIGY